MNSSQPSSPATPKKRPLIAEQPMPEKTRKYLQNMSIRSGAYAILMSLYFFSRNDDDNYEDEDYNCLTKAHTIYYGQPMCHGKMRIDHVMVNEMPSEWQPGIKTVESSHSLVQRFRKQGDCFHHFALTPLGVYFCQLLLQRRAQDIVDAYKKGNPKTGCNDTTPDVVEAEAILVSQPIASREDSKTKTTTITSFFSKIEGVQKGNNPSKRKPQPTMFDFIAVKKPKTTTTTTDTKKKSAPSTPIKKERSTISPSVTSSVPVTPSPGRRQKR